MGRRRNKGEERAVAVERMDHLLGLAAVEARGPEPSLAGRYAALAWRLATKYQVGLEVRHKAAICRRCQGFMVPGTTCRTRIGRGLVRTTCLGCGLVRRRPLGAAA
ncbi:MAG: ribonuclease P protein component 4 [Thermoplasmatota archaeon]